MATIRKAQDGNKTPSSPKFPLKSRGEVSPYYKAEQEANKKKGFEKGTYTAPKFKNKMDSIKSEFKGAYGMRKGGSVKRMQAGGVAGKSPKAGMVDPKGAYTKVQTRTLGNMKRGGSVKKAQNGTIQPMGKDTRTHELVHSKQDENYKMKFKDKSYGGAGGFVQRRTLKGFLKGAPKAAGKIDFKSGGKMSKKK